MDIQPFAAAIERQNLNCEGVIALRRGERAASHFWTPPVPRNVFSVSKSFTAVAAGIAIDEGKISLRDKVLDRLGGRAENQTERLAALTLEHCLTMTRGHGVFSRPRTAAEALSQELSFEPGAVFVYDNGSTLLVSAMISAAAGQTVRDYLLDRLFRPLGIPDPRWSESADGHTLGATGLEISIEDLARFGQFLLRRGSWEGKQLVSASWIDAAGRPQVSTRQAGGGPDYDLGYGYGFWPCRRGAYRADGKLGQFLVVLPRQEAVVAITSAEENMSAVLGAVWDHILPRLE